MVSAKDLAFIRQTVNNDLPGTAVIYTRSITSDGAGGQTFTYTASGTVDARYGPEKPSQGDTVTEMREIQRIPIWIPVGGTVQTQDYLKNPGTGTDYEIIGITKEASETGVYRCECVRVR